MSKSNPYRDWLGLGADIGQPNYYQLLGIAPADCAEKKTVVEAANRQLAKLKLHRDVENRAALQQLVEEIKAAAKCLASSQSRNAYNASLLNSTLRQSGTAVASEPFDSNRETASIEPKNKSPLQAIPAAIPLAIPVDEPNTPELPTISSLDSLAGEVPAIPKSSPEFRLVTKNVLPKRRSPWPMMLCVAASLAVVGVAATIMLRQDLRDQIFGKAATATKTASSPIDAPSKPTNVPPVAPTVEAIKPQPAVPMDSTPVPVAPPVETTVNSIPPSAPEMSPNNAAAVVPPESSPENLPPVEAVKETPIPDAAFDFYVRSVISALAINDIDTAVELFSRISPEAVSDKRLDMLQRLGTIANAYKKYFDWLKSSADAIPGGTSLEIGPEKLPISIVESSAQYIVYRDRGTNWRMPLELVPRSIAWGIIDQMQPGEPSAAILKPLVRSIGEFGSAEAIDQATAIANAYSSEDQFGLETKAALIAWLQTDRPLLATASDANSFVDAVRFAEIVTRLSAEKSGQLNSAGEIYLRIVAAFETDDRLERLGRLEIAKRMALDLSEVGLASCIQQEMARDKKPADAMAEMISYWNGLEKLKLDARQTHQLCIRILQFEKECGPLISAAQQRSLLRVAETHAVKHPQSEYLIDAIRQVAARDP